MTSDKCLLSVVPCTVACFRVAQWSCSENESSSWTETNICSPINKRSGYAPQACPACSPLPFCKPIACYHHEPAKRKSSRLISFLKSCVIVWWPITGRNASVSPHKPAYPLPVGTPGAPREQSYPPSHVATALRNTSLAVHRCMWSSCLALTCPPPSLVWIQALLVFSTQLQIIPGWIVRGPLSVSQGSVPTAFLVLSSDEFANLLLGTMREEWAEPLRKSWLQRCVLWCSLLLIINALAEVDGWSLVLDFVDAFSLMCSVRDFLASFSKKVEAEDFGRNF